MKFERSVAVPPSKPVLVYDGGCAFCRLWVRRWRDVVGDRIEYLPLQDAGVRERFPELSEDRLGAAVHLVDADGVVYYGAEAAFRALGANPDERWLLDWYLHSPRVARAADCVYGFVGRRRGFFSRLTRIGWGPHLERPRHQLVVWAFLRALGLIYLAAFLSLNSQILGLAGGHGVQPAAQNMELTRQAAALHQVGLDRYHLVPTLCWISTADGFLRALCLAGVALALCVVAGIAPAPCLFLLWVIYLSLATVCREFMAYQWDNLLLETGLLAVFLAPLSLAPRLPGAAVPSRLAVWLFRLLLFKLVFESGLAKWLTGDPAWGSLTALRFYFETQPLPTWLGVYAHQLPFWLLKAAAALVLASELLLPVLIFAPRRVRLVPFAGIMLLQLSILLTGNYGYLNLLTMALCLPLLDDAGLARVLPSRLRERLARDPARRVRRWPKLATVPLAGVVLAVTAMQFSGLFRLSLPWPRPLGRAYEWLLPFRSFNGYGMFGVVNQARPEIVVEGSDDGVAWREYEFKYKPGNLKRRPGSIVPHQPRLDWQMWFAAMGNYEQHPWLINACYQLLQGSKDVLGLLEKNPFPQRPPRYVRAVLYRYEFAPPAVRQRTGAWWQRQPARVYMPAFSTEGLARATPPPPPAARPGPPPPPPAAPKAPPRSKTK